MAKLTLPIIASGYLDVDSVNNAFREIEAMAENVVYRTGDVPNQMEASLDLNGFPILNAGAGDGSGLLTYSEAEALIQQYASGLITQKVEVYTATAAQTNFTTVFPWEPAANNLAVYVDGLRKYIPTDYTESASPNTITFTAPMAGGEKVLLISNDFLATAVVPAHQHAWTDIVSPPLFATRWPTYAEVTGKPTTFTPATHQHATTDIISGAGLADARRGVWVQASTPTATRTGDLWFY